MVAHGSTSKRSAAEASSEDEVSFSPPRDLPMMRIGGLLIVVLVGASVVMASRAGLLDTYLDGPEEAPIASVEALNAFWLGSFIAAEDPYAVYTPTVATPPPEEQDEDGVTTYTVVRGDWLAKIAQRLGVSVRALVEANDILDPTRIEVGQVLIIPTGD